jgi:hypothetical protein
MVLALNTPPLLILAQPQNTSQWCVLRLGQPADDYTCPVHIRGNENVADANNLIPKPESSQVQALSAERDAAKAETAAVCERLEIVLAGVGDRVDEVGEAVKFWS